jgi:regulator of protease activity HflC (stomatin/prohibitin superfamily)
MTPIFINLIFVLLLVATFKACVKFVPQASEWTIERFGKYLRTLKPGLNFILPFIDQVGFKISLRETVFDIPSQDVITKDNAMVRVDGVVFYQVLESQKAAYAVSSIADAIMYLSMTNIRTVMGAMDLDQLLSNREEINNALLKVIDEATSPWGIKVTRVEIKDITPPKDLVDSMARQMKAERDKRATILEAEGQKQASILYAEGQKQAAVLEAEGQKLALVLNAEARKAQAVLEAEARERQAEAEAKATDLVSSAISNGNTQAINYFVATKYIDSLKTLAESPSNKVVMMPYETTSVISSISGIAELTKNMFKND